MCKVSLGYLQWFLRFREISKDSLPGPLTLFQDMGFFEQSVMGGMRAPHHNFVVIAPMTIKFGTDIMLDLFYKKFVTLLLLSHYDVITCILAYA